ncbi:MAG TPA: hypothetical protein VMW30_07085 [Candidatus Paceibacterota bacterium]|nr:hypothetical protein [Candidatus Paceibacterota bacterium]
MMKDSVRPGVEISTWCEMKWTRGISHLSDLQDRISQWDTGWHTWAELSIDPTGKHLTSILRVESTPPLAEMSLLLGDAVHNMRSALDALAWELCHLEGNKPANPKQVFFPASLTESKWREVAENLKSMPPTFIERIKHTQPYLADPPAKAFLAVLAEMSNRDKHRGMISARANASLSFEAAFEINHSDLGQATSKGTVDGFDIQPFGDNFGELLDGNPHVSIETSARIALARSKVPVALDYTVDVGGSDFNLREITAYLYEVKKLIYQICNIPVPE